ncbi:hypothetical protein [Phenylobacterium sp. NIBR 498073]|uniref:hypothetical protein n=1 Tax=Phenylobacterium sp. NIBR 498073 TaxID=3015177 RepID=UPI0022B59277|nr:hypothetical protein [Phenylobacterium sp. NIBR 498073]WGU40399.1 hypothetical protein O4N75_01410 [Phenylobacterium sp. NIBR 498073]
MQALLLRAPYERIADRLAALAPDLDVVVLEPDGGLTLRGAPFDPGALKPDIWWLSLEAFGKRGGDYFPRLAASPDAR